MKTGWRPPIATAIAVAMLLSSAVLAASIAAQTQARPAAGAKPPATAKPRPAPAAPSSGIALDTAARHALIVEVDTGTVLFDKHAEERMPPASMSKIMTAYVVFSMLKEGRVTLSDELPVSEKAWRLGG